MENRRMLRNRTVGMAGGLRRNWGLTVVSVTTILAFFLFFTPAFLACAEGVPQQNVLRAVLANGLKVVIVRNNLAPVVTTMVNYLVGSVEAPEGFPGMAHAQEHMMFRGSPGLSADQLAGIIAATGGKFNADTQQTITQYFLTVPSADLDTALHLEAIRMRGVDDSEKLWAKERGAIEQEVAQDYSSPEFVFYTKLLAAMFKGTPYAESPLGSVSSFDKTTGAALKEFYSTWYAPNNAVFVIVGDVDPTKTLAEVKRYFEDIPAKELPARPPVRLQPVTPETIRLKTDESYGLAIVAFRLPGYKSADYPACRVLSEVLSSQRGTLYALVPEGKALYAGFSLDTMEQVGLGYAIGAFPKGADAQGLASEMRRIVSEQTEKGFPDDLVNAAKLSLRTRTALKKNSILGLAMAWSDALTLRGKESPEAVMEDIERVTVEDVNKVAKKYLLMDRSVVTILTPESSGKPVSGKSGRTEMESFAPAHGTPVTLPSWAEKTLKRLEIPPTTLNPVVTLLPNGLKVIVQPESVSDTVSVYGRVRSNSDMEAPKGKKGVDEVLGQLFSYGTTTLDRIAFQKALDEIGAQESAGTDFSLQVLSEHFERGVKLLADNLLNPALPEAAFKVVRQQVAATAAGRLQSPNYLAGRALKKVLFPKNDPTLRETTPKSASSLSLSDVVDYHHAVFRPDVTTIVVIGKVTAEEAKSVIEKHFGSWKATGPVPLYGQRARLEQDPVKGNTRADPGAYEIESRLLCSGVGQSRPRRRLLCDPPVSGPQRRDWPRLLRYVRF
jgi:zinc protease